MDVNELIASVDIVEYIGQFVDLEEKNGEWWGLSCFKQENTPSFSVRRDPPLFYDYSSGAGGNLYSFIRRYFNCGGPEAVEKIKQYAGVDGEITGFSGKLSATQVCRKYAKPTHTQKESKAVVLPDDYMERYEHRDDKLDVWRAEGISDASMERFQVRYDSFSNRLVYPIHCMSGKIVNVGGRTLDPDWKEKQLRKYCYFYPWGSMDTIYGVWENLNEIQNKREVILFEGCKSVLIADTWGIRNTGALLTSHLNANQMKILAKLGCRVVFALDKDVKISDDQNIQKLRQYVQTEYLSDRDNLLNDKDSPVDRGAEVFRNLYEHRIRFR